MYKTESGVVVKTWLFRGKCDASRCGGGVRSVCGICALRIGKSAMRRTVLCLTRNKHVGASFRGPDRGLWCSLCMTNFQHQ